MGLQKYKQKRSFNDTPEPKGAIRKGKGKLSFVIQRHDASRLHYDFRLEANGVLKSWAIPKGPSLNPADKRLAVMVEDHPVSYGTFEGDIPKGNYGAGHVDIWDHGTYEPVDEEGGIITEKEFLKHLKTGSIKFKMQGRKLKGSFALVQMKGRGDNNWLLIKHRDEFATDEPYDSEEFAKASSRKASAVKAESRKSKRTSKTIKNTISTTELPKTTARKKVNFTHPDKVYFPDEGITKGDIINYYNAVHKFILPHLKNRPESLRRTPNGIRDEGFFHKDVGNEVPDWIDKYPIWSDSAEKEINYIVCNDRPTLLYMTNMGCIELNPWNSTTRTPNHPDYVILDLDPSDKNTFDQVIDTALLIHEILEKADCPSYCKTSGATGLHIYVPLGAKYDYNEAQMFAEMIAIIAQEQLSSFTSLERSLAKRGKDKIYIDYLQNKKGQTLSCAYSVRPKPGAPVSTPLEWKELKQGLKPGDFTIFNTMERLEKKGDIFLPVIKRSINMEKVLKNLEK